VGRISPITKHAVYRACQWSGCSESDIFFASEKRHGFGNGDSFAGFLGYCGGNGDIFRYLSFSALDLPELRKTIFRSVI
jgi:hypothetical protein